MDIQHVLQRCLPIVCWKSVAEIDAEIREELEFHLDMRTQDNLRSGMSPEDAHRDAQRRFGDFEAKRRACRKISLGPRLRFQRLQAGLFVLLIGAVIYQGVLLVKLQTVSRDRLELVTQMVEQLQAAGTPSHVVTDESAIIPYVHWDHELPRQFGMESGNGTDELLGWQRMENPLQQPWSDWRTLDKSLASD